MFTHYSTYFYFDLIVEEIRVSDSDEVKQNQGIDI